ncbi:MAG: hypothetical protein RL220_1380 [Bacteroidota bacterium]
MFTFAREMTEKEISLLDSAVKVFMRFGVKSINMDDMARHLGVSKKTLYLHFKDKEDMLARGMRRLCITDDQAVAEICSRGLNAIDESLEIMKFVSAMLRDLHPSIVFDIEKYHPEVYREMMENRQSCIYGIIYGNLKKGQKEGLYRKDMKAEIIAGLYIAKMTSVFDTRLFPNQEFTAAQLYDEFFIYHIRGIASPAGIARLEEKLKTRKKN